MLDAVICKTMHEEEGQYAKDRMGYPEKQSGEGVKRSYGAKLLWK